MSKEAMKLALEALEEIALAGMSVAPEMIDSKEAFHARQAWRFIGIAARAMESVKKALAEQPAPGRAHYEDGDVFERISAMKKQPAQRTWVNATTWRGLTDEEIDELSRTMVKGNKSVNWLCRAIEAKLREKNGIKGDA